MGQVKGAIHLCCPCGMASEAATLCDKTEKFIHRHLAVGGRAFREVADFFLYQNRIQRDIVPIDSRCAGGRTKKASNHLHRSRLSCPVWAEKAENVSSTYRESNAIHGAFGTVGLNEAFYFNHGGGKMDKKDETGSRRWDSERLKIVPSNFPIEIV